MKKSRFFIILSIIFLLSNFYLLSFLSLDYFHTLVKEYLFYLFIFLFLSVISLSYSRYFIFLTIIILSCLRFYYFTSIEVNNTFVYDGYYTFTASIEFLDKKNNGWQIKVKPKDLNSFSGKLLVYTSLYPEYSYTNVLEISCKVYKPEIIVDEKGKIFHYDKYLAKDRIFGSCFRPRIKIISQDNSIKNYFLQSKQKLLSNLNNNLVEPASSLSKAIVFASRREISTNLRDIFARVGLSHVIAISGMHIAIIVFLLQAIFIFLGLSRKFIFYLLLFLLFAYLVLLNFPSSALRASSMVVLFLLGSFLKRKAVSLFTLIFLADLFIFFNPYLLLYDIGFQLSFLAVLGLLLYIKFFNTILIFVPKIFHIREVVSVTLSAQVFTWPLIVYHFNILSLVSPLSNIIILPILPLVIVLSFLLSFSSLSIISWPLFILLKAMVVISKFFISIPFSFLELNNFNSFYLFSSFVIMILLTIILKPYNYE